MTQWLRRHRADILLFVVAVLWFLPAIWWGLPTFGRDGRMNRWGPDELGPWGAINALRMLTDDPILQREPQFRLGPQYPLVPYLVQGILVWPYHAFVKLADHIGPGRHFHSLQGLMVLHRLPSVLLAAGTVVAARELGRRLHDDWAVGSRPPPSPRPGR